MDMLEKIMPEIKNFFDTHAEKQDTAEEKNWWNWRQINRNFPNETERERRNKKNNLKSLSKGVICI